MVVGAYRTGDEDELVRIGISSPVHWSRFSSRTRPGGLTRCAMPARMS
jgi:hypothetical protein